METTTGRIGLTDTGCWMLDAGLFVVQVSDDVRIQDTRSPFTGVKVKNWLFVPELMPFTFHRYEGVIPP